MGTMVTSSGSGKKSAQHSMSNVKNVPKWVTCRNSATCSSRETHQLINLEKIKQRQLLGWRKSCLRFQLAGVGMLPQSSLSMRMVLRIQKLCVSFLESAWSISSRSGGEF